MPFTKLSPLLAEALKARGYEKPTPVQAAVLEPEAEGRDLIVSAQTGSGKTVAFGLAMAPQLLDDNGRFPFLVEPLALVIAPTRELALQVSRELKWLYEPAGVQMATCVGGMDASKERRTLRRGAHVIVGTPGRLRDHLERGALDLSKLRAAVLDEADEMLDMGFREDLEEILDATGEGRRTLMFSATIPKPIINLAKRYQNDAMRISTVGEDRGHGDIAYQAITVAPADTENAVVNLLRFHEAESAMLFCATRESVRRLHASLVDRGFSAVALSGEHTQAERNQAMQALRSKRARVCVATDVAARGLDLPTLSLVIHVEIPRDAEALQHRSGRTGRAGKKGTAVLVVPYQRRKRVESMLRGAKIDAEWKDAPTRADIRKNDAERLIETLLQPVEIDDDDLEIAKRLMAEKTPEEIAAMLVQSHRAKMPAPEQMLDRGAQSKPAPGGPRPGFEDTVWFKMNVGHNQRADARWILPVLCRRGHITKNEIGAIRINGDDTLFEIPRRVVDKFTSAIAEKRSNGDDTDDILITQFEGKPRDAAKRNRKGAKNRGRGDNASGGQRDYSNASKKFGGKKFGARKHGGKKKYDGKSGGDFSGKKKFAGKSEGDGNSPVKRKSSGERSGGEGYKKKSEFGGDRKAGPKSDFGGKKKKPHRGKRPFTGKRDSGPKSH
ncbi:ATP-dependent RNA helicase Atu4171 [hydrothermal vent metagenome]|uniref:ATP-dependent RNA helicase Atu4171 n=1 Tax=hydrothermal vent metagenome TaxID=652676 RepID=A0A3B0S5J5_9ZZZZ